MPATDIIDRLRRCLLAFTADHARSIHCPVVAGKCTCGNCLEAAKLVAKLERIAREP